MRRLIALSIITTLFTGGNALASDSQKSEYAECPYTNYGNGVHYFDCTRHSFGEALSEFKSENPALRVTAIVGSGRRKAYLTFGYIVSTEER